MKRTILLLLVAVLSVATMNAQETKKAIYVIDGKQIENFDGSQLEGKTVRHYSIEPKHNIHMIFTTDSIDNKNIKRVKVLSFSNTDSIPHAQKYSGANVDSIIGNAKARVKVISSQVIKADSKDIVYVLDDKVVSFSTVKGLPQSNLKSVKVIKDKNNPEYIKYAKELGYEPKGIVEFVRKK